MQSFVIGSMLPRIAERSHRFEADTANLAAGDKQVKLCQSCSSGCGVLDEEFTVPVDSLGDLPFGTVFPRQSGLQCRSNLCVPGHVADPKALCRVVADEALLYHTRRLLGVRPPLSSPF